VKYFSTEAVKVCTFHTKKQISLMQNFTNNSSAPLDECDHTLLQVATLLLGLIFPNRTFPGGK
jgi:hypothetical protein